MLHIGEWLNYDRHQVGLGPIHHVTCTKLDPRSSQVSVQPSPLTFEQRIVFGKIKALNVTIASSSNPLERRRAKKQKKIFQKMGKAVKSWADLSVKYLLTCLAREGHLARVKRSLERLPSTGFVVSVVEHSELERAEFGEGAREGERERESAGRANGGRKDEGKERKE